MAAEDAIVDAAASVAIKIIVEGVELGLRIVGGGGKAIALGFYALSKHINDKRKSGKNLSAGEVEFEKLMKSGEEIHSVWLNKDDLANFSQIAKQLGITFVSIQNGDELKKGHKFLSKKDKNGNTIEFAEDYKNMVSISYRASDAIRMAHILEMFDNFGQTETKSEEQSSAKEEVIDEVEEFMKENGVEFERPPEATVSEEVNTEQQSKSQVSDPGLSQSESKTSATNSGKSDVQMCFEQFGFDRIPDKALYDAAYIKYITENKINPSEPNYITALYEQGCKIIAKNHVVNQTVHTSSMAKTVVPNQEKTAEVADCFKFFGFDKTPTVQELKTAYFDFIEKNGKTSGSNIVDGMYDAAVDLLDMPNEEGLRFCYEFFGFQQKPTKTELDAAYKNYVSNATDVPTVAKSVYENALTYMQNSDSIRQTLQAKRELNKIHQGDVAQTLEKAAKALKQEFTQ